MIQPLYEVLALVLLSSIVVGLVRVLRGPGRFDRMLAAQLFGTCGVALSLLLSVILDTPELLDVGLVFAILAALTGLAFVRLGEGPR